MYKKKRLLSLMLVLAMLMQFIVPVAALAQSETDPVPETVVTAEAEPVSQPEAPTPEETPPEQPSEAPAEETAAPAENVAPEAEEPEQPSEAPAEETATPAEEVPSQTEEPASPATETPAEPTPDEVTPTPEKPDADLQPAKEGYAKIVANASIYAEKSKKALFGHIADDGMVYVKGRDAVDEDAANDWLTVYYAEKNADGVYQQTKKFVKAKDASFLNEEESAAIKESAEKTTACFFNNDENYPLPELSVIVEKPVVEETAAPAEEVPEDTKATDTPAISVEEPSETAKPEEVELQLSKAGYIMIAPASMIYSEPTLDKQLGTTEHGGMAYVTARTSNDADPSHDWLTIAYAEKQKDGSFLPVEKYVLASSAKFLTESEIAAVREARTEETGLILNGDKALILENVTVNPLAVLAEAPVEEVPPYKVGDFVCLPKDTEGFESAAIYDGAKLKGLAFVDSVCKVLEVSKDKNGEYVLKLEYIQLEPWMESGGEPATYYFNVYVRASDVQMAENTASESTYNDFVEVTMQLRSFPVVSGINFAPSRISFHKRTINLYGGGLYGTTSRSDSYYTTNEQLPDESQGGTTRYVYAPHHKLDGITVYCMEHNMPSPKGSYYSRSNYHRYNATTTRQLLFILTHGSPDQVDVLEFDSYELRNSTQMAVRQLLKKEGTTKSWFDIYKPGWRCDRGQMYGDFPKWLHQTANALPGQPTLRATVVEDFVRNGDNYVGKVKITGNCDEGWRLPKNQLPEGTTVTGNGKGQNSSYYLGNNGDTITVTMPRSAGRELELTFDGVTFDIDMELLEFDTTDNAQRVMVASKRPEAPLVRANVKIEGPKEGTFIITKRDKDTNEVLAGRKFHITGEDGFDQTLTTDENGVIGPITALEGTYTATELEVSVNYQTPEPTQIEVVATQNTDVNITNEKIKGYAEIIKLDDDNNAPIPGTTFTITDKDNNVVDTIVTGEDGKVRSKELIYGTYTIRETAANPHYEANDKTETITVTKQGEVQSFTFQNTPKPGWIQVTKTDSITGGAISGVVFDIYKGDEKVGSITTDEKGVAKSEELKRDVYRVVESKGTNGYYFETVTFDKVQVNPTETTELTATNKPVQVVLEITKKDSVTGDVAQGESRLTGATFKVTAAEPILDRQGNVLHEKDAVVASNLVTDGDPATVKTGELWPGKYNVIEVTPPLGYEPNTDPVLVDTTDALDQFAERVITYTPVKENEVKGSPIGLIKILGDNKQVADPGSIENPEAGAVFQVYLKSAGSYDAAKELERDLLTTDARGYAESKKLPYGEYVVKQVSGKSNHTLVPAFDVNITGDEELMPMFTLNNRAIKYRLCIVKVDKETGRTIPLEGTTFTMKDADGKAIEQVIHYPADHTVSEFVTDKSGTATLPDTLAPGAYTITEIVAPEGYVLDTTEKTINIGGSNNEQSIQAFEAKMEDQPVKGKIEIEKTGLLFVGTDDKTDENGNTYKEPKYEMGRLEGATFQIIATTDIVGAEGTKYYSAGDVAGTITTTKDGPDESNLLPLGEYGVKEVSAPSQYTFPDKVYPVKLEYADEKTPVVSATVRAGNDYVNAKISLKKIKQVMAVHEDTAQIPGDNPKMAQVIETSPAADCVFGLYAGADITENGVTLAENTLVATGVTDAEGNLTFEARVPHGAYYVKEISTPHGWKLNETKYNVDLTRASMTEENVIEQTVLGEVLNEIVQYPITITKKDITEEKTVLGAVIEVYDENGKLIYRDVTDADGNIKDIPLVPGKYKFVEVIAPEGYELNRAEMNFTVDENGKVTGDTTIVDDFTRISVSKEDWLGYKLEGVEFTIFNEKNEVVQKVKTNKDGVAEFVQFPYGKYTIRETATIEGYLLNTEFEHTFIADGTWVNDKAPAAKVVNQPIRGSVKMYKYDELLGEKFPLANAEFTVTRVTGIPAQNGELNGQVVVVLKTDDTGYAQSEPLPYGVYEITETKFPEHFQNIPYTQNVGIVENEKVYEFEAANRPNPGWIQVKKADALNGNPIEGVVFDIYQGEELIASITTNKEGIAKSEDLVKGEYRVVEHQASPGYVFEPITFNEVVVKSDETTELKAENKPVQVQIKIMKRDAQTGLVAQGDAELTGATFRILAAEDIKDRQGNVVFAKGAIVEDNLVTEGKDITVVSSKMYPGLYSVVEITPPQGYKASEVEAIVDTSSAAEQSEKELIVFEYTKENDIKIGRFTVVKQMGDNKTDSHSGVKDQPEAGAEFEVYLKASGLYKKAKETERDYLTTDDEGKATTKELPYGTYVIHQVKGAKGYELAKDMEVVVSGDEPATPVYVLNNWVILYRVRIIKTDKATGKVITLGGATFKIKDAEGNYVEQTVYYPTEKKVTEFVTNESGMVTLPGALMQGDYTIVEIKAPNGYMINTTEIPLTLGKPDDTAEQIYNVDVVAVDEAVSGHVIVEKTGLQLVGFEEKTDEDGLAYKQPVYEEKRLEGAVFDVISKEVIESGDGTVKHNLGDIVDTITTTADGEDKSKDLPLGKYALVETAAPVGFVYPNTEYPFELAYVDQDTPNVTVTVKAGNTYLPVEINVVKEIGALKIVENSDGTVHQVLDKTVGEGFKFGLYAAEDITAGAHTLAADTLVATAKTDAEGKLKFEGVYPHGNYYVKELQTKDGYKLNETKYPIALTPENKAADKDVIVATLQEAIFNELITYPITLSKTDITGEKTIPGALIEVYNEQGKVIYREYTDKNGVIPDIPVIPGKYTFKEILAPEGYALNVAVMTFTVAEDGTVTGDNAIRDDYTRVTFIKQDEGGKVLPGVEFGIFKKDADEPLKTVLSDENGVVTFEKIPFGEFVIRETKQLPGYCMNDVMVKLTVDGTFLNPEGPIATLTNKLTRFAVLKTDEEGRPLAGAEFAVMNEETQELVRAVSSDENGIAEFVGVPEGKYVIKEVKAPEGYLLDASGFRFAIASDYKNPEKPIKTIVNKKAIIPLYKRDSAGNAMAGVEFSLIDAVSQKVVMTVMTDEKGSATFSGVPIGSYIIRETRTPDGYTAAKDIEVKVDKDYQNPLEPITIVNIPNHFEFLKVNNGGEPMADVKFGVYKADGSLLTEVFSGNDGWVRVKNLAPGKYTVKELSTHTGYQLSAETLTFDLVDGYKPAQETIRFVNYPNVQTGVELNLSTPMIVGLGAILLSVLGIGGYTIVGHKRKKQQAQEKA